MSIKNSILNLVLIVDDEPMARTLLRLMLVRAGFDVLEAEDGQEALDKMKEELPDVVILDVMMPGMNGFAVCAEMAKVDRLATIPVMMLSAKTDIQSRKEGLSSGATRYLTKPIAPDVLTQHVHEILAELEEGSLRLEGAPHPDSSNNQPSID